VQIYRRGGKWWAQGYYVDANGRRKRWRRSTGAVDDGTRKSQRLAEQIGYNIAQSLAAGLNRKARPETLHQGVRALVAAKEGRRSQAQIDIYTQKAARLYGYFGAHRTLESITAADLERYARESMATEYLPGKLYKAGTVLKELRVLCQAFDAVGIPAPPIPDLGRTNVPGEIWYDAAQQRALVQACHPSYRDHVILYLQMGLRESELYKLDLPDFARGTVRVRGTKTLRSDRTVDLSPDAAAALRRTGVPVPRWRHRDRALKAACKRAGVPPGSTNALRHSFATLMAMADVPILKLAAMMGTSVRMLERVYTHLNSARAHEPLTARLPRICAHSVPAQAATTDTADKARGGTDG
jgi:integrase